MYSAAARASAVESFCGLYVLTGLDASKYGSARCVRCFVALNTSSASFHEQSSAASPELRACFLSAGEKATSETGFKMTALLGIWRIS